MSPLSGLLFCSRHDRKECCYWQTNWQLSVLNMSRYSGGQDNEFWLEAWNGNPYIVERMGRDPICVEYLLVGVVGGFQPDKLSRSLKGDLDGMYARVLFSWPSEPPYRPLTNE